MQILNTEALVLKRKPSGDTSLIVHVLTEKDGKLILVAKGARSPKSKWRGHLEPYNHVNIHYYYKKDRPYQLLSAGESLHSFHQLKKYPDRLLYAAILLEILDKTQLDHSDPFIFKLILHILNHMEAGKVAPRFLHWYFILIFLKLNGFDMNLDTCAGCNEQMSEAQYSPVDANLYCTKCQNNADDVWFFNADALNFLRYMIENKVPGLESVNMDEKLKKRFDTLFWHALAVHFDSLRFMNSIKMLKILD